MPVEKLVGQRLHDHEQTVARVEFLDLLGELDAFKDAPYGRRKAVDVGPEVRRDVSASPSKRAKL